MASRRDQLQSYQFLVQRVVSALVLRETDPAQTPLRRMTGAAFAGVMVAVIALAAVGVFGFISPGGNTRWQDGKAVIVERESGTRYLFTDGVLHQVENFASARLLLGTGETVRVSAKSLLGVPRGPRLGIPRAPDALPDVKRLLGAPWTLCSQPGRTRSNDPITRTALVIGDDPQRGGVLGDRTLLVQDSRTGTLHLVWQGYRYPIAADPADAAAVRSALSLQLTPVTVNTAWLNALPRGRDLGPVRPPGTGEPSSVAPGARIGDLFVAGGSDGRQYFVARATDLQALTDVEGRILLARQGGAKDVGTARGVPTAPLAARVAVDPPAVAPARAEIRPDESTACAVFRDDRPTPVVTLGPPIAGVPDGVDTAERTEDGAVLADAVVIREGFGALVEAVQATGLAGSDAPAGTLSLVTEDGRRYPIPTADAQAKLGYGGVRPVRLLTSLVARIPVGPALDPAAARKAVS